MTNPALQVMGFPDLGDTGAKRMRRQGLPNSADFVTFCFDREQRGAPNGRGINDSSRTLELT
jgi:hypothetical protein